MRVLYVNLGGELVAGSEGGMLGVIARAGDRMRAHVLCNSRALAQVVRELGHEATVCDLVELSAWTTPKWQFRAFWAGVKATLACVDRFRPDLLAGNNVWAVQFAVLAGILRRLRVVAHVRSMALRSGQELSLIRLVNHTIALSAKAAAPFAAMRWRRGGVSVVYDPVTVDEDPLPRPRATGPLRLAIAGRLSDEKAVHRAIDLLAWLRERDLEAVLTIYGDGPERDALTRRVEEHHLERVVTFAGFRDDLPRRLRHDDVLLLCSLREGLGRVIVEAGLCAVPTVAVRVGGVGEAVEHARGGMLVGDFESPENRQAVLDILRDRGRLREMGARAREFCRRRFDPENAARTTLDIYRRVLAGRARKESPA